MLISAYTQKLSLEKIGFPGFVVTRVFISAHSCVKRTGTNRVLRSTGRGGVELQAFAHSSAGKSVGVRPS